MMECWVECYQVEVEVEVEVFLNLNLSLNLLLPALNFYFSPLFHFSNVPLFRMIRFLFPVLRGWPLPLL